MPEPKTAEPKQIPFDPQDRGAWCERLRELPVRAIMAFAVRCAKRVEPLYRLGQLQADAYSAGLEVNGSRWSGTQAYAATDVAYAAADVAHAAVYAARAAVDAGPDDAAAGDLMKLRELRLGKSGEPGQPIRWNDPRLGPLWPDSEPEWYAKAVGACRELEEWLRNPPDPNAPPPDPNLEAQLEDRAWLDEMRGEGKLDEYRGEYVVAAEKQIFDHGRNLVKVRPRAEKRAMAKGIPPERLVFYFMPGLK